MTYSRIELTELDTQCNPYLIMRKYKNESEHSQNNNKIQNAIGLERRKNLQYS